MLSCRLRLAGRYHQVRQLPTRKLSPQKGKTSDKPRLSISHFPPSACRKKTKWMENALLYNHWHDICCQKEIVIRHNCHILETTMTLFLVICVFWAPPYWHEYLTGLENTSAVSLLDVLYLTTDHGKSRPD